MAKKRGGGQAKVFMWIKEGQAPVPKLGSYQASDG